MEAKKTKIYYPLKNKEGKPITICGLPVFTFANNEGKRKKPAVYGYTGETYGVDKDPKAFNMKCDMRFIPITPAVRKLFDDNPELIRVAGTIMGTSYYLVPFVAPDWFICKTNFRMAQMWIAESFLTTPSNSYGGGGSYMALPLNFLIALCDELKVDPKTKSAAITLASHAIVKVNGSAMHTQYDSNTISMLEYSASMNSILAVLFRTSHKKLSLTEYKLTKKVVAYDCKIVKKVKNVSVPEEQTQKKKKKKPVTQKAK